MSSLSRRLQRAETIIAGRATPAAGGDGVPWFLWISAVGEYGPAAVARLSGAISRDPADWSAFFTTWATFAAVSNAWQARGDTPPVDNFYADAPAVLRARAWHLAGFHHRSDRPRPEQLRHFSLLVLHALDRPLGREDRECLAERATMPAEVLQVFLDDPEAVPSHDCIACGVFLPVTPGALAIASAVVRYAACPLCGGRVGADLFRWREQHAASAAAARGDRLTWPAVEAQAEAGQHDDAAAGAQAGPRAARRPVDVGRGRRRDDDDGGPTDFGLAAGRPRRPLF
jgi:hypothetical protein